MEVDFQEGLTVITGETGAGKSVLLGALSLLLGKRADLSQVRGKEKKCVIEGIFSVAKYELQSLFTELDLDYEEPTILRREILPSGKSRAFVNDSPVNLQQIQQLGEFLVDIHSQFDTRHLASEAYQLEVVDALAENNSRLAAYTESLNELKRLKQQLKEELAAQQEAEKEADYNQFLWEELQQANLAKINQEDLEATFDQLNNAESIQQSLSEAIQLLSSEEVGSYDTLSQARSVVGGMKNFGKVYEAIWERFNSLVIEVEDVLQEVEQLSEKVEMDPAALSQVQSTLENLYRLQKKHQVDSVAGLLAIEKAIDEKLKRQLDLDDSITQLRKRITALETEVQAMASEIREHRLQVLPTLKNKLEDYLKELGLHYATFEFILTEAKDFREHGKDMLELRFSANKGIAPDSLQKTASGGEMSRIMLSVKALLALHKNLPTIIFDEIDTGVSGEIAHKMATIMAVMGEKVQLICITHLPQIAARGLHHKKVFKVNETDKTFTNITTLNAEERIAEIAQMIGGGTVGDSAIAHAKELLN